MGSERKKFFFIKIKLTGEQGGKKVCGKCAEKWLRNHEKVNRLFARAQLDMWRVRPHGRRWGLRARWRKWITEMNQVWQWARGCGRRSREGKEAKCQSAEPLHT